MRSQVHLNVDLPDALTASMCSHLTIEFFKHLAYQRQQLPFPYTQIMSILGRSYQMEGESSSRSVQSYQMMQAGNEYRKVKEVLSSMQSAFKNLEDELRHSTGLVDEVAMIFGATPLSPRDVFRLQFPPLLHGHRESKHPHQNCLLQLIRCLISSEELHSHFSQPLSPTNMFILIRKRNNDLATCGFTPKERYSIPPSGKHAIIRLIPPTQPPNCICGGSNIFQDQEDGNKVAVELCEAKPCDPLDQPVVDCWFQSLHSMKGLSDIKINGISAYSIWLNPR